MTCCLCKNENRLTHPATSPWVESRQVCVDGLACQAEQLKRMSRYLMANGKVRDGVAIEKTITLLASDRQESESPSPHQIVLALKVGQFCNLDNIGLIVRVDNSYDVDL